LRGLSFRRRLLPLLDPLRWPTPHSPPPAQQDAPTSVAHLLAVHPPVSRCPRNHLGFPALRRARTGSAHALPHRPTNRLGRVHQLRAMTSRPFFELGTSKAAAPGTVHHAHQTLQGGRVGGAPYRPLPLPCPAQKGSERSVPSRLESSRAVATPQAARERAHPPCRHFNNQSCCCLGLLSRVNGVLGRVLRILAACGARGAGVLSLSQLASVL
jgi:hypothetical protein